MIDAIQKAIYYKGNKYLFNIGFGKSHSVKEIISIIQKIYNTNLPVVDLKLKRKIEINDTVADIKLSNLELGWKPKYDIEKGIMNLRNLDTNF